MAQIKLIHPLTRSSPLGKREPATRLYQNLNPVRPRVDISMAQIKLIHPLTLCSHRYIIPSSPHAPLTTRSSHKSVSLSVSFISLLLCLPLNTKPEKMLLRAASAFSLSAHSEAQNLFLSSPSSSSSSTSLSHVFPISKRKGRDGMVVMASKEANNKPLTGVIFEPFEEVKKELQMVPVAPQDSLARQRYSVDCEAAVNEQINVEYNVSYVYHALFAYFDRDNVALKGLAKFFKESSAEEREHAEKLMEYQNKRGGRVKLQSIVMPLSEFDHVEKGDALYAMELALSLEKLTNEKLLKLHHVAERSHDVQMTDFIEGEFLAEQVEAIKKISEYVAQLRRVGKGHGVWHFDQMLLHEAHAV